jgi:hypothetical protein
MKNILLLLIFFFTVLHSFANNSFPAPPAKENTEDFFFKKFVRQPDLPDFIEEGIQRLEHKNATLWDGTDSLYFALRLSLINDYEHALNYYVKLNLDTISNPYILHLIQLTTRKTARFQRLLSLLEQEHKEDKENYVYRFRKRIAEVRLYIRDRGDELNETIIFSELLQESVAKKSREELIKMTKALDQALRIEILYTDDNDRVISKAYEEFGDYLLENFYLSNAFISYHIARFFSHRSNSAQKKVKSTRDLMHEKNLLLPSFARTFTKIKNDRYSFAVIVPPDSIDMVIYEKGRFLELDELLERDKPRKDYLPWLDTELMSIFVLFLALLFTIFVIKRKNKNR